MPKSFGDFLGNSPRLFGIVDLKALLAKELHVPDISRRRRNCCRSFAIGTGITSYEWCAHDLASGRSGQGDAGTARFASTSTSTFARRLAAAAKDRRHLHELQDRVPRVTSHFVTVGFSRLDFTSVNGGKPDLKPVIDSVKFGGALGFLDGLRKGLNFGSVGSGPSIHIGLDGIEAAFGLSFPKIPLGVFNLKNLSFGAKFTLNFLSAIMGELAPRLRFNVAEPDRPFLLTVGIFGGGGYFFIEFHYKDADLAIVAMGAALEFGGSASIDVTSRKARSTFSAASTSGSAMTRWRPAAYLRCGGSLKVIGLITISAEFAMTLGYHNDSGRDYFFGRADAACRDRHLLLQRERRSCRRATFRG